MLIRNILTKDGLVNGAMGTVESFRIENGVVESIYVRFDDRSIGQTLQLSGLNDAIEIEKIEHSFIYAGRHIVRYQFPLRLCWACTIHKVEGLSLDSVVADLGSNVFENGMSYV